MNLLRSILSEAWAIEENYALQMMPLVANLIKGEAINTDGLQFKQAIQYAVLANESISMRDHSESNENESPEQGVVAVLPIYGVLMKYDAFCGPRGMKTIDSILKQWDQDPNIVGIVLDMDSPGGQASYLPNLSSTIQNLKKPIISYYSGTCASACYYIASQTNEIYASADTDTVGSIGTMLQFLAPHPEQKDFVVHTIYATKSTDKNKPFEDAIKGEYNLLRSSILDPINEEFHTSVLSARPEVNKATLSGSTFNTQKAIEMKLIDGRLATLQDAIARVFTLSKAKNQSSSNQNTNSEMKKFERISAILGKEVTAETVLTVAEMEMIENHSETPEATSQPAPTAEEIAASMSGTITSAVQAAVAPVQESITALETRLGQLEGSAGADATVTNPTAGANSIDYSDEPWTDPNDPINKHFDTQIGG
jgi:protease-4